MSEQNKAVVRRFLVALGKGDGAALSEIFSPDAQAIAMGFGAMSATRSYDEIVNTAGLLSQLAPEGIEFTVVSMTAEDDRVSCEAEGKSTLINGVPYNNQYHFLATVRDGKIARLKEYYCTKLTDDTLRPLIVAATA
ncbi:MAG: nuclear transport factor 2 family protein [Caulobacterales bacterium]